MSENQTLASPPRTQSDKPPGKPWYQKAAVALGIAVSTFTLLAGIAGLVWFIASEKEELKVEINSNQADIKLIDSKLQNLKEGVEKDISRIEGRLEGMDKKLDRALGIPELEETAW